MGLDICNFSIEAWPILNIQNFNHWKKIQIDRDIFFYMLDQKKIWSNWELRQVWIEHCVKCPAQTGHFPNSLSHILWYWMSQEQSQHWAQSLHIFNILMLLSDRSNSPNPAIRLEYKLLMKVEMIGPKAGMNTAHSIYLKFELIEIFNKTRGMLTWVETGEYIRIHYSGYVKLYVSGTQSIWHQRKWLNIPGI